MKIATKTRNGVIRSVTIWTGAGRSNRWQSRLPAVGIVASLIDWLRLHGVSDAEGWIADNVPYCIAAETALVMLTPAVPPVGVSWAIYGHIAVIRPENGGYIVSLGIHGGCQSGAGGFWPTPDAAIASARRYGARQIVCCAQGENGGDCTPRFSAALKSAAPL